MHKVNIKAMTVNQCWQGRRFKTKKYDSYREELLTLMPSSVSIPDGDIVLSVDSGTAYKSTTDVDNLLKPFIDALQIKYEFNDSRIKKIIAEKFKTKKGEEFIHFNLSEAAQ